MLLFLFIVADLLEIRSELVNVASACSSSPGVRVYTMVQGAKREDHGLLTAVSPPCAQYGSATFFFRLSEYMQYI